MEWHGRGEHHVQGLDYNGKLLFYSGVGVSMTKYFNYKR